MAERGPSYIDMVAPSLAEAMALAHRYDLPNVDDGEEFWTGEPREGGAFFTNETGIIGQGLTTTERETVCVTTPTN